MKTLKLKSLIPELFLILSVIYYWVLTSNLLNPFAIGLLLILIYQIVNKKAILGIVISITVIVLTLFLVLAMLSELHEFETVNQDWKNLIIFGSLYFGLNLIMAGFMFFKYVKLKIN